MLTNSSKENSIKKPHLLQIFFELKKGDYAKRIAFLILKDHKENIVSNSKCRLLNPSKSEIGLMSKTF